VNTISGLKESEKYSDFKNPKNLSDEYEYKRESKSMVFAVATFSFSWYL